MTFERSEMERVGSPRVPDQQVLADCLDGLRDAACSAINNTADGWNVWVAGAAYAVALGTGLRPQELVRVRARDVSLKFGVVTVSAPKVGAPRLVPLSPALLAWLDPLVGALTRVRQDQTPCLCLWQDDGLVVPTPVGLQALARRILGPRATVPALGQLRHGHLTRREDAAHEAEGSVSDPEADRWRSALCGHGQTGGWSIYLPQRFARAHRQLCAEQQRWLQHPPPLGAGPFLPPPLKVPIKSDQDRPIPQARSARDWVLAGVQADSFPLDHLGPARKGIWGVASQLCEGSDRAAILAGLAAVELVGFGDLLCSDWLPRLQRLQWQDWQPNGEGVWLRFSEHDGPPPLRVWGGPTVSMIGDALRQLGEPSPLGSLDQAHVRRLLQMGAGLRGSNPMQSLQQANLVLHLFTHANDEIGYLAGRVERLVIVDTAHPARHRRVVPDHGLADLRSRLQHFDGRVTQRAFDRLVKESCPSVDYTSSALQPLGGQIVASLRLIYRPRSGSRRRRSGSPRRRSGSQRLRSRSPHTLLARLTDLCLIASAQEATDHGEDPENWGPSPTGSTRRRAAASLWTAYHRRAKLPFNHGELPDPGLRARSAPLATWRQIDSAIRGAAPAERPTLALYAALATRLRAAELSRVHAQDIVIGDQGSLSVWVTHGKGGQSRWTVIDGIAPRVDWVSGATALLSELAPDELVFGTLVSGEVNPRRMAAQVQRRFLRAGCQWHAHMMRTLWATSADRAGIDRATISIDLAHVLVRTVTTNYVALDEIGLLSAAAQLSAATAANVVSVAHVAAIRGVGRRQAERDHARLVADLTWSDSGRPTPQGPGGLLHPR
ncbi:MAG: tyrosine-type recombinase/integrase [Candidatus Dormibacteria bacterium]